MSEAKQALGRKSGLGLVKRLEGVEIARVNSVNY